MYLVPYNVMRIRILSFYIIFLLLLLLCTSPWRCLNGVGNLASFIAQQHKVYCTFGFSFFPNRLSFFILHRQCWHSIFLSRSFNHLYGTWMDAHATNSNSGKNSDNGDNNRSCCMTTKKYYMYVQMCMCG